MNRINQCFETLRQQGRKALVPYIVAGDPGLAVTVPTMHAMVAQGADIIELGIPFSDPNAEGPVIQRAHERALAHNVSLRDALAAVAEFRQADSTTPVLLMGYANPIERMGYEQFIELAVQSDIDGVLTVDLPPEEAETFNGLLREAELQNIFLIAPTSSVEREKMIVSMAGGFIYYVSLKGVTGAGHLDIESVEQKVAEIRTLTDLPVCVGFGIRDNASATAVAALADGVVVGSVLVNKMGELAEQGITDVSQIAGAVSDIVGGMRNAIDSL